MGDWAQVSVNVDFYPPWSEIKIYQKYCKSSQITAIFPWDIKFAAWGQRWDIFLLAARVIFAKDTLKLILLLLCGWQVVVVSSPRSGVVTSKNNCQLLPELRVEFEKQQQNLLTTNNIKMVLLFVSWPDNNKEQHRKAFKYVHMFIRAGAFWQGLFLVPQWHSPEQSLLLILQGQPLCFSVVLVGHIALQKQTWNERKSGMSFENINTKENNDKWHKLLSKRTYSTWFVTTSDAIALDSDWQNGAEVKKLWILLKSTSPTVGSLLKIVLFLDVTCKWLCTCAMP